MCHQNRNTQNRGKKDLFFLLVKITRTYTRTSKIGTLKIVKKGSIFSHSQNVLVHIHVTAKYEHSKSWKKGSIFSPSQNVLVHILVPENRNPQNCRNKDLFFLLVKMSSYIYTCHQNRNTQNRGKKRSFFSPSQNVHVHINVPSK